MKKRMPRCVTIWTAATLLLLCGCEKSPLLPEKDPRMEFLRDYYPHLHVLRDQVAADIVFCRQNSARLKVLRSTFEQPESQNLLDMKLAVLQEQCTLLEKHLNQIDMEAEKGIARKAINDIDGGGTRLPALTQLSERCREAVEKTRRLNTRLQKDTPAESLPERVPRVLPVNVPRATSGSGVE